MIHSDTCFAETSGVVFFFFFQNAHQQVVYINRRFDASDDVYTTVDIHHVLFVYGRGFLGCNFQRYAPWISPIKFLKSYPLTKWIGEKCSSSWYPDSESNQVVGQYICYYLSIVYMAYSVTRRTCSIDNMEYKIQFEYRLKIKLYTT